MTQQQRRAAPRYELRLSAELKLDGRLVTGVTRNLSMGGLCLELDRPLDEGALLQLRLFLVEDDVEAEGQRGLELTGTVQWAAEADRGFTVGVEFGNLTAAQSSALTRALQLTGQPAA